MNIRSLGFHDTRKCVILQSLGCTRVTSIVAPRVELQLGFLFFFSL